MRVLVRVTNRLRNISLCCASIVWAATAGSALAQSPPAATTIAFSNEVEAALVRALETLRVGGIQDALREIDLVLEKNPHFQLGHLIKGDLLMAKSGAPLAFTGTKGRPELVANLRHEARARLARYFDGPPPGHLPTALLQLAPEHKHVLLMDSEKSRLYVFRNVDGLPQLVTDFYISAGKNGTEKQRTGDQKTPIGVYRIMPAMAKNKLTDFYGSGAFPLNFPNEWDKRLGKTGSGIWIHGTPPDTYSRPPRASDGCVVLTNDDFSAIAQYVDPGVTPIVITSTLEWQSPELWLNTRQLFTEALEQWARDWESLNIDGFLAHYSRQIDTEGKSFAAWADHKKRLYSRLRFINVAVSNLAIFEYPLSSKSLPLMMVTFNLDYKSNTDAVKTKKRQYWQLQNGRWKIVYEANA